MSVSRRQLLSTGAATGALAGAAALLPAAAYAASNKHDKNKHDHHQDRDEAQDLELFGPLTAAPGALLALPPGFSYEVVAESGKTTMTSGALTPNRPDGTNVVAYKRGYRLVQNHELGPGDAAAVRVPLTPGTVYDAGAEGGGCTVIETDARGRRVSEWVGLSGTISNCAGGPTPWGTWLTCEESDAKAGTNGLQQNHGYVFEVFPDGPSAQTPLPIKAWGRFAHEAVVVEPSLQRAYLTEDASTPTGTTGLTGLFYRWTARAGRRLGPRIAQNLAADEGTLEALAVIAPDGSVLPDLAYVTSAQIGRPFATSWVNVPDRAATTKSIRTQFGPGQVTHSKKLEGAWGDAEGAYFVSSFSFGANDLPPDATQHDGQLWYYRYADATLTLMAYYPYSERLHTSTPAGYSTDLAFDGPDGCHVSPYGSLVLTEDGVNEQHLISWSRATGSQAIARNLIDFGGEFAEMTGPCFSPDGKILFANVQEPGHCFAITGPWERYLGRSERD